MEDPDQPPLYRPAFYALRSGQAPLLASINLSDRHFVAGQKLTLAMTLCDDTGEGRPMDVHQVLVSDEPGFKWPLPDKQVKVVWQRGRKGVRLAAGDFVGELAAVTVPLPQEPGRYYLLSATAAGDRPVAMSRRIIDVVAPPDANRLAGRTIAVFAADAKLADELTRFAPKANLVDATKVGVAASDVLLVGPMIHRRLADLPALGEAVKKHLAAGGRVVVLNQDRPIEPLGLAVPRVDGQGGASTAFRTGPGRFPRAALWQGLGDEIRLTQLLRRFNGPTGAVVRLPVSTQPGDEVEALAAQDSSELNWPVIVTRPAVAANQAGKGDKGGLIFCQMPLEEHLSQTEADPVAQTILVNLLSEPADGR